MRRWEEEVDSFWLVTVVLIVSHGLLRFVWDVYADGGAAKRAVFILLLSNLVGAVGL